MCNIKSSNKHLLNLILTYAYCFYQKQCTWNTQAKTISERRHKVHRNHYHSLEIQSDFFTSFSIGSISWEPGDMRGNLETNKTCISHVIVLHITSYLTPLLILKEPSPATQHSHSRGLLPSCWGLSKLSFLAQSLLTCLPHLWRKQIPAELFLFCSRQAFFLYFSYGSKQ